jgi:hypothetical protein
MNNDCFGQGIVFGGKIRFDLNDRQLHTQYQRSLILNSTESGPIGSGF